MKFKYQSLYKNKKKEGGPIGSLINTSGHFKTKLSIEEEKQFQRFYNTLPDNLMTDDETYDIRGYWDAEGRPDGFVLYILRLLPQQV